MASENLSKEELISMLNEFIVKMNSSQEKINKIESFYSSNLVDSGEQLSNQTKIANLLDRLNQYQKDSEESKNKIQGYNDEIFLETESRPSIKKQFENQLTNVSQIEIKAKDIQNNLQLLHNENFLDEEGKDSKKTQINKLIEDSKIKYGEILNLHKAVLIDEEGKKSLKSQVETTNESILKLYNELATDESGKESLKTKMDKLYKNYNTRDKEHSDILEKLKTFYKDVFEDKNEAGFEAEGLKKATENLKLKLEKLIQEATQKLHALTDSSLHNSFFTRAKAHTEEYEKMQTYTFRSVVSIAAVTLFFAIIQMINILWVNHTFSYQLMYYQLGISLPLIYVVWMYNRNQKIAKKLAEEYHHKAALSEAMTGYRDLYQLKHESAEYMDLFNGIKEQLNINPSTKIDKFLSLKSPQENLINKSLELANPKSIADIAKNAVN